MNFILGLPKIRGVDTVLVVIDRLSKYEHLMTLQHLFTAKEVAEIFIKEVVHLHSFPKTIITDGERVFMSGFWRRELFRAVDTYLKFSSANHPQMDGLAEIVNRSIETYLWCFCIEQPKS